MQTANVTRWAWLSAGLPETVGATTVDAQCGSSEQALSLGRALIASGQADVVVACGVEMMSRVPMGSPVPADGSLGSPPTQAFRDRFEYTSQFDSADRIARQWGLSREDCDAFAVLSQQRAAAACAGGFFDAQIVPVRAVPYPETDAAAGIAPVVSADEGPRPTSAQSLAGSGAHPGRRHSPRGELLADDGRRGGCSADVGGSGGASRTCRRWPRCWTPAWSGPIPS